MLVVGLIPLVGLFLYGYFTARQALIEASNEHLLSVVGARQAQIQSWLRERVADLEVISLSQDCNSLVRQASSADHAQVCHYLDSFQAGAQDYQVLALYDLNWNWVAAQTGADAHREGMIDPEFKERLPGAQGAVFARVHHHSKLGIGFHAAQTLQIPGQPPTGYVVVSIDLTGTFAPVLADRAGLGKTGRVLLADRTGTVLLDGTGEADTSAVLEEPLLHAASRESKGTVHYRDAAGKQLFAGFTVLPERDWILIAQMNEEEALALGYSLRRGILIVGLITLIAVVLVSSRTSRRLSAPLAKLASATRQINLAGPGGRVPETGGPEISDVGRALNELLESREQLQRQQAQTHALAAVGEFSSNLVHEMRNRLSSVKMNLQAIERRLKDDNEYIELSRIALAQVRRTEETLDDLLNYARPVEPVRETVALVPFLAGLADQFRAQARSLRIGIEVEDHTGESSVYADRRLLDQAVSNLVRNALEVAPAGGTVILRASASGIGDWVHLEVEDDGPGFNGLTPEQLFQPFFTTKDRGAGLGLPQTQKIAELHGGKASARTGSNGGAVFRIEIPGKETRT